MYYAQLLCIRTLCGDLYLALPQTRYV